MYKKKKNWGTIRGGGNEVLSVFYGCLICFTENAGKSTSIQGRSPGMEHHKLAHKYFTLDWHKLFLGTN